MAQETNSQNRSNKFLLSVLLKKFNYFFFGGWDWMDFQERNLERKKTKRKNCVNEKRTTRWAIAELWQVLWKLTNTMATIMCTSNDKMELQLKITEVIIFQ